MTDIPLSLSVAKMFHHYYAYLLRRRQKQWVKFQQLSPQQLSARPNTSMPSIGYLLQKHAETVDFFVNVMLRESPPLREPLLLTGGASANASDDPNVLFEYLTSAHQALGQYLLGLRDEDLDQKHRWPEDFQPEADVTTFWILQHIFEQDGFTYGQIEAVKASL